MPSRGPSSSFNEAIAQHQAGKFDEAVRLYRRWLIADPKSFDALHLLGLALYQQGKPKEAVELLTKALRIFPQSAACEMHLAVGEAGLGEHPLAIAHYRKALRIQPNFPEAWDNLAYSLKATGEIDAAIEAHCKAIELKPDFVQAWNNLGLTYALKGRTADALCAHRQALTLDPRFPQAHFGFGVALQQSHRISEAISAYGEAVKLSPDYHEARSARLLALHYVTNVSNQEIFSEHVLYGKATGASRTRAVVLSKLSGKRLRVGFISPDFRNHSVSYFIEPLLRHLDRTRLEIFLYHDHYIVDGVSQRLRANADHFKNFVGQTHDVVEGQIRADQLDVIVDLAGHTGMNRLPVLARRVAPVQISYLGYPDTTGVPAIDYRLVDAISDPEGTAESFHTEKLVRWSPTSWVYQPPSEAPVVAVRPPDGAVRFCCFNNFSKVSAEILEIWSGVLNRVPSSILALKSMGFDHPDIRAEVLKKLHHCGISEARVELVGWTTTVAAHLDCYQKMDVALDSFPYHGTTTTCEALWMGLPVVTLLGDRHCARVTPSLLSAVGHPEWIARTSDEYVEIAVDLAQASEKRAKFRVNLREDLKSSLLMDYTEQARRFTDTLWLLAENKFPSVPREAAITCGT